MTNKQETLEEIGRLGGIQILVSVYEEVAATRMRKIRDSVLKTRDFLSGIAQIFKEVQTEYKNEVLMLMERKKIKDKSKLSVIKNNGKTVMVLISSNTGFYGDIIRKTFDLFSDYLNSERNSDITIIGRVGRTFFEETFPKKNFMYFDFPDSFTDLEMLKKISTHLAVYEKVVVFHGQFQSIVTQTPNASNISDTKITTKENQSHKQPNLKYFFEPSLEKILLFFETEIFTSIFEQTVHESQLAKFASRMVALDKTTEKIKDQLKRIEFQQRITAHREMNKKQLETFSGMRLWS